MPRPFATVLISTYNYGRFIEEAIDSVLSQDFSPGQMEVLVIDDGSTDDTARRVEKYGSQVEYYYKPNGGQASALNFGIAKARGEIVTLLDADDFFLPTKLARVAEAFERDPTLGLVYHRLREWHIETGGRQDWEFVEVSGDLREQPEKLMAYVPLPTSGISFRRTALRELLPIPEELRMVADCYLAALIPFLAPVLAIPEVLAIYRIHGTNAHYLTGERVSMEARCRKLETWRTAHAAMRRWLESHGYSRKRPEVRFLLDRWTLHEEDQEFALAAPGRMRFLCHLMRYNRVHRKEMSWRLRAVNLANAFGALFTGYRRFPLLERWRSRLFGALFFRTLWRIETGRTKGQFEFLNRDNISQNSG